MYDKVKYLWSIIPKNNKPELLIKLLLIINKLNLILIKIKYKLNNIKRQIKILEIFADNKVNGSGNN